MSKTLAPSTKVHLLFRVVAAAALAAAFFQVTLGGVVRVTGSGLGCPDWPLCHGRIIPPLEFNTLLEYSHRLSASALGVLVLATAVLAWRYYRPNAWVLAPSLVGLALVLVAAILGGVTVLTELAWWGRTIHLSVAESLVACMVVAVVAGWRTSLQPATPTPGAAGGSVPGLLLAATAVGTFLVIISGSYMVGSGAGSSCATWPLCRGSLFPEGAAYAIHMGHRLVAALAGLLVLATAVAVWRRRLGQPALMWAAGGLVAVFLAQVMLGAATVWTGFAVGYKAAHLSLATLTWVALVWLMALRYTPHQPIGVASEASPGGVAGLERLVP